MSEALTNMNQEITYSFFTNKAPDSMLLGKNLKGFEKYLGLAKNNITEKEEDKLVYEIDATFNEFRDSIVNFMKSPKPVAGILNLQKKFNTIYPQLELLSQLNEKAIEIKTEDAKTSAKNAYIQMSLVGGSCFIIAFLFTISFASYFNERFKQLYHGIKEMASSNYGQRLYFNGKDEFYEISLIFNEMAEKLSETNHKNDLPLHISLEKENSLNDIQELKRVLSQLKNVEEQAQELISNLENKK
jgi:methyl-accepting chemotaxis protein